MGPLTVGRGMASLWGMANRKHHSFKKGGLMSFHKDMMKNLDDMKPGQSKAMDEAIAKQMHPCIREMFDCFPKSFPSVEAYANRLIDNGFTVNEVRNGCREIVGKMDTDHAPALPALSRFIRNMGAEKKKPENKAPYISFHTGYLKGRAAILQKYTEKDLERYVKQYLQRVFDWDIEHMPWKLFEPIAVADLISANGKKDRAFQIGIDKKSKQ